MDPLQFSSEIPVIDEIPSDYFSSYPFREKPLSYMEDRPLGKVIQSLRPGMKARCAESEEEVMAAYSLVYREYLSRGYCESNRNEMYYHSHCFLPSSQTFVLEYLERMIGTVTLIADSVCGLPIETAAPQVAGELRFMGRRIAEVSLLTLDHRVFHEEKILHPRLKIGASFMLFKTLLDYARQIENVTDLLIIVHPNHETLYTNLGFQMAGGVMPYKKALGNPGLPMHLDIPRLIAELPAESRFNQFFFENPLPAEDLKKSWELPTPSLSKMLEETCIQWEGIFKGAAEFLKRRHLPV